jgi:hypothetical protein
MTELSIAARSILDDAAASMQCPDGFLPYEQEILAAGLKAAATRMVYEGADEAATWLTEIAAELDGATTTSENV